jgi:hypothetical protein
VSTDEIPSVDMVCVCSGNLVPGGSVVITRYQSLPLSPRESPPCLCHPVVLAPRTPWGAFRRGFRQVPRSLVSGTRSDVTTWAMSHQVFIAGTTCISSKGPCIPSPLKHTGQLGGVLAWRLGDYLQIAHFARV